MDKVVIEYVQGQIGSDPISTDSKSYISLTLFQLFRHRRKTDVNVPPGTNFLEVQIPGLFLKEGRTYIGREEIKAFEEIMQLSFEERVIETIYERLCYKQPSGKRVKYKEAVLYAHKKFGLTEEILPHQTRWKRVQRHRQLVETPSN